MTTTVLYNLLSWVCVGVGVGVQRARWSSTLHVSNSPGHTLTTLVKWFTNTLLFVAAVGLLPKQTS